MCRPVIATDLRWDFDRFCLYMTLFASAMRDYGRFSYMRLVVVSATLLHQLVGSTQGS